MRHFEINEIVMIVFAMIVMFIPIVIYKRCKTTNGMSEFEMILYPKIKRETHSEKMIRFEQILKLKKENDEKYVKFKNEEVKYNETIGKLKSDFVYLENFDRKYEVD